jgi:hypothetical protein
MKSASSLELAFVEFTNALRGVEPRKMFGHPAIFTNGSEDTEPPDWVARLNRCSGGYVVARAPFEVRFR